MAAATAANAWLMQPMLDRVFVARDERLLLVIPAAVIVLAFVKGIANYVQAVLMTTVGQRVVADIQLALFARPDARRSRLLPRQSDRHADLALHQRRQHAARRGDQRARGPRQGGGDRGLPGRADVLPGLAAGARRLRRLPAGAAAARQGRPAHAPGLGRHPGGDGPVHHAARPDLPGRAPRQGLWHGGLRDAAAPGASSNACSGWSSARRAPAPSPRR